MNGDPETVAWMRLVWGCRLPPRIVRPVVSRWLATGCPLSHLFATDPAELAAALDLLPHRIDELLGADPPDVELVAAITAAKIQLRPLDHPDYPPELRHTPEFEPPLLLCLQGAIVALERPAVAVVGSRAADEGALAYARELAADLVCAGYHVVSGNAPGIDRAAHAGAAAAGGPTSGVLAQGLLTFAGNDDLDLVVSAYHPRATWKIGHALARNGLITALSRCVVVIQGGTSGGTWNAANLALSQGRPVFVRPDRPESGGVALLPHGAKILPLEPAAAAEVVVAATR